MTSSTQIITVFFLALPLLSCTPFSIFGAEPLELPDGMIPRLAVLTDQSEESQAVAALLETRLSAREDLIVLDRRQVRDMLAEQEWMLTADSMDDAVAVRVGTFLHCDLVAELQRVNVAEEADELPTAWVLTTFDTATGIRLLDKILPDEETFEHTATLAGDALIKALRAQTEGPVPERGTLTLGTIRTVSLLPEHSRIGAMLQPLLERSLMRTGKFTLLERQRLNFVNREAVLSEDRREQLLASIVVVDIDLMQTAVPDKLHCRTVLTTWNGHEIAVIEDTGKAMPIADLSDRLTAAIVAAVRLEVEPTALTSRQQRHLESARFLSESLRSIVRSNRILALQHAESAVALAPDIEALKRHLHDVLWDVSDLEARRGNMASAVRHMESMFALLEQWKASGERLARPPTRAVIRLLEAWDELTPELRNRITTLRQQAKQVYQSPPLPAHHLRWQNRNAVPIWAENTDQWLEGLHAISGDEFPVQFRLAFSAQTLQYQEAERDPTRHFTLISPGSQSISLDRLPISTLSQHGKQRFFEILRGHAENGNPEAALNAFHLVFLFQETFDTTPEKLDSLMNQAIDLAATKGSDALHTVVRRIREILDTAPQDAGALVTGLQRVIAEGDRIKVVFPEAYLLLDHWDHEIEPVGHYLLTAARLIVDTDYRLRPVDSHSAWEATSRRGSLSQILHVYRKRYREKMPDMGFQPLFDDAIDPVWESQRRLYAVGESGAIRAVEVCDDYVWALVERQYRGEYVKLLKIDPSTENIYEVLRQSRRKTGAMKFANDQITFPFGNGMAFVCKHGTGTKILRPVDGLPPVTITAAIRIDETLFIGGAKGGEGMLLRYCMRDRHYEILASSARVKNVSELDNTQPYRISGFFHDKPRHRLLFCVLDNSPRATHYRLELRARPNLAGIWSLDLSECASITQITPHRRNLCAPRRMPDGRLLVDAEARSITLWDPRDDMLQRLTLFDDAGNIVRGTSHGASFPYSRKHLWPPYEACEVTLLAHGYVYVGWFRSPFEWDGSDMSYVATIPDQIYHHAISGERYRLNRLVAVRGWKNDVIHATTREIWISTPVASRPTPPSLDVGLQSPRAVAGNEILARVSLPECDAIQWGLRHRSWKSEPLSIQGPTNLALRLVTPTDYQAPRRRNSDRLVIWAYRHGELVAQKAVPVDVGQPYRIQSLVQAMDEAEYGVVAPRKHRALEDLLSEVRPAIPILSTVTGLIESPWDVAVVDAAWLRETGDAGANAVRKFLAQNNRRILLAGTMDGNPFLPSWHSRKTKGSGSDFKGNNPVTAVDYEHGLLYNNAADWLTVNDWNNVPAVIPTGDGDHAMLNFRPVFADTDSGAPFIVEIFPPDGGRLLCIPFDFPTAIRAERYAGFLLFRALRHLGQAESPAWRKAWYLEHPFTMNWLNYCGVRSPRRIDGNHLPSTSNGVLFLRADQMNASIKAWLAAGGTAMILAPKRGQLSEPASDMAYRGLLRGITMPYVHDYAASIETDHMLWTMLTAPDIERRALLPGILDEAHVGAGRLLILATPEMPSPPARGLLSILLTNCGVRLGQE